MSSIRDSKKLLNQTINNLVDEAYNVQLDTPSLKEKSDALIEQIVEYFDEALAKLHDAKSKKELSSFKADLEQKGYDFYQEIMNLHL